MDLETSVREGSLTVSNISNASIFLGVLYGIVFLFSLPIYFAQGYDISDVFSLSLLLLLIAIIVHVITNGLYYLVIVFPAVMAGVFFITGSIIWLFAPVTGMFLGVLSTFLSVLGVGGVDTVVEYGVEFITRIGQTLITIGGALWWLVAKAKEINYKALYVYIIFLTFVSLGAGFISPGFGALMLILWATVSLKVKESFDNKQLQLILKIAASATLVITAYKTYSLSNHTWHGNATPLIIYAALIFLFGTFGIWQPGFIKNFNWLNERKDLLKRLVGLDRISTAFKKMIYIKGDQV